MDFKDFAHRLFPIVGAGSSTHAFTRSLFEAIIGDEGQCILDEYGKNTYKAYYNGNTQITQIAKKISPYIEQYNFINYISQFSDATMETIIAAFADELSDTNAFNVQEKLAGLFISIINEAAAKKRNPAKSKTVQKGIAENVSKTNSSADLLETVSELSHRYYHLLVTNDEDVFVDNIFSVAKTRMLNEHNTPHEIYERCGTLSEEGMAELKTFPTIICMENTKYHGQTDPDQMAVFGYIRKIQKLSDGAKILFRALMTFPQHILCDKKNAMFFDLDMERPITDLNHSAWTIHETDIFEAFEVAGARLCPQGYDRKI